MFGITIALFLGSSIYIVHAVSLEGNSKPGIPLPEPDDSTNRQSGQRPEGSSLYERPDEQPDESQNKPPNKASHGQPDVSHNEQRQGCVPNIPGKI